MLFKWKTLFICVIKSFAVLAFQAFSDKMNSIFVTGESKMVFNGFADFSKGPSAENLSFGQEEMAD